MSDLEAMLREALANEGRISLGMVTADSSGDASASVFDIRADIWVSRRGSDPIALLRACLIEYDRVKRDGKRVVEAKVDPRQGDIEDVLSGGGDDFEDLLG